jgi:hypothetical protein
VSSSSIDQTPAVGIVAFADRRGIGRRVWIAGAAAAAWLVVSLLTALWPDKPDSDWEYTQALAVLFAAIGAVLAATVVAGLRLTVPDRIQRTGPWLVMPMPFFPPPQALACHFGRCLGDRHSQTRPSARIAMQTELVSIWQRAGFTALLVTHDVEEALFLARRVLVLSDRPARIKTEIVNDRPYPRHRGDPRLVELRHEVLTHLGMDESW